MICTWVGSAAGLGMVDWKGRTNPLVEAVKDISIFGEGRERTPEEEELDRMRGPVVAADYRDDPRLQAEPPGKKDAVYRYGPADDDFVPEWVVNPTIPDNKPGSYEQLRAGWGEHKKAFQVPD